jgi:hypothetical protein
LDTGSLIIMSPTAAMTISSAAGLGQRSQPRAPIGRGLRMKNPSKHADFWLRCADRGSCPDPLERSASVQVVFSLSSLSPLGYTVAARQQPSI